MVLSVQLKGNDSSVLLTLTITPVQQKEREAVMWESATLCAALTPQAFYLFTVCTDTEKTLFMCIYIYM